MPFTCSPCDEPCCSLREGETGKKILLFPEEVAVLEGLAVELGLTTLAVVEDMVFPDARNERVLVGAYRLFLERHPSCAFMDAGTRRCMVHERSGPSSKPLVCQAYPIAIVNLDAISREYHVDTGCPVIARAVDTYEPLKRMSRVGEIETFLSEQFPTEFVAARRIASRFGWIHVRLRQLEHEGAVSIPETMDAGAWEHALRSWPRLDLVPPDD